MNSTRQFLQIAIVGILLAVLGVMLSVQINLPTADLGRHLKNGELLLTQRVIPQTNLYSYTHPNFPFIDHHWGSGLLFYLVYLVSGFRGLSALYVILSLAAFLLYFDAARRLSHFLFAVLSAVFAIPLIASRVEVRPEIFSYFFSAVFLWLLVLVRQQKIKPHWLWLLPVLQVIWVNLHIYFFLGELLVALFFLDECYAYWVDNNLAAKARLRRLAIICITTVLATLLNPKRWLGAIYPLLIMRDYGYRLFENQSVQFLDKLVSYAPSFYFKVAFWSLGLSWLVVAWGGLFRSVRGLFTVSQFLLSIFISYAAWTAVRNFAIFGYVFIPLFAGNFKFLTDYAKEWKFDLFTVPFAVGAVMGLRIFAPPAQFPPANFGWGLAPEVQAAAVFFKQHHLSGPVFNNYDIGSYLIYNLYPAEKVFVDNRPEAYPVDFFKNVYIPAQESDEYWQALLEKYQFETIFFYRHDLTPWAQKFLLSRVADPVWAPVYVDNYSIIFARRDEMNAAIIKTYEIPTSRFSATRLKD